MLVKIGRSPAFTLGRSIRRPASAEATCCKTVREKTAFSAQLVRCNHFFSLHFSSLAKSIRVCCSYRSRLGLHAAGTAGRTICRHSLVLFSPIGTRSLSWSSLDDIEERIYTISAHKVKYRVCFVAFLLNYPDDFRIFTSCSYI